MQSEWYRYALWITLPTLSISIVALVSFIVRVVRLVKRSLITRVPLAASQIVEFAEAGPVILCIEGPRFTTKFAWLKYRLETEDGAEVPWRRRWFRAQTSGVSTVRMELRKFVVPRPGRYVLHVEGIKPAESGFAEVPPNHALVFMKPHLAKAIALVVGITLSSVLLIVSLVFSLIRILDVPT